MNASSSKKIITMQNAFLISEQNEIVLENKMEFESKYF